jgi:hypothetical protein
VLLCASTMQDSMVDSMFVIVSNCTYASRQASEYQALVHLHCCVAPQAVAKSFGFAVPPRVNLPVESKSSHARKVRATCHRMCVQSPNPV